MTHELNVDLRPEYPVSWQAAAINGVLRGTMRPISTILVRNTAGMAVASRIMCLGERVPGILPKHVSIVPDRSGSCTGEWVHGGPGLDERKVVLYFHGGAYFVCSPATHRPITWRLSAAAGCPVFSLDYRQGPVHSLAESLSDALQAYERLLDLGYAAQDIVLAGDSAGGISPSPRCCPSATGACPSPPPESACPPGPTSAPAAAVPTSGPTPCSRPAASTGSPAAGPTASTASTPSCPPCTATTPASPR
ncbi:hypothetical protein GCM10027612_54440 [Microbispora bryophytorum subsp. camponoti]